MSYFEWCTLFFLYFIVMQLFDFKFGQRESKEADRAIVRRLELLTFALHDKREGESQADIAKRIRRSIDEIRKEEVGRAGTGQDAATASIAMMCLGALLLIVIPVGIYLFPYVLESVWPAVKAEIF